jgi:2-haloacid dehalogenase
VASVAGEKADALIAAYHEAEHATQDADPRRPYSDVLRVTLERAAVAVGLALDGEQADVLARTWSDMPIFPDTEDALNQLHADGWQVAILTNCDNGLFAQSLARFPVAIDMLVTSEEVGSYKPALGHFEAFEKRSGVSRDRWVHAAVSWFHDMRPARDLDIRRVWVDREDTGQDPSICSAHIRDMASLPTVLRSFRVD